MTIAWTSYGRRYFYMLLLNPMDGNVLRSSFTLFQFLDIYTFYMVFLSHHMHINRVRDIPTEYIGHNVFFRTFFISFTYYLIVSIHISDSMLPLAQSSLHFHFQFLQ